MMLASLFDRLSSCDGHSRASCSTESMVCSMTVPARKGKTSEDLFARATRLRFDSGDAALDADVISRKYFEVIVGYHRTRGWRDAMLGFGSPVGQRPAENKERPMSYVPHTERERRDMLAAIGVAHMEDLFAD